jgi:glycosyltransferase involved in cell wall biosynthesis
VSPGVSIIICCFNSAGRLLPTLSHIAKQKVSDEVQWEVILVNNASTDDTVRKANEIWIKLNTDIPFRIINEDQAGLMYARQKGMAAAKYEFVSFIDDDNWVEENWVEKVYYILKNDHTIGACGGSSEAVFECDKPEWFMEYENNFAVGKQADETGYIENKAGILWGAGLTLRKSLWIELKMRGFKDLTIGREGKIMNAGEDTELCYAFRLLGYHLYYKEDLTLKHFIAAERMSYSYLEKLFFGFGKSNVHLNCYRVLLNPENFRIRAWWYEWGVSIKSIIRDSFISLTTSDKAKREKARTDRAYWKGYACQTWRDKARTKKNIAALKSVFTAN